MKSSRLRSAVSLLLFGLGVVACNGTSTGPVSSALEQPVEELEKIFESQSNVSSGIATVENQIESYTGKSSYPISPTSESEICNDGLDNDQNGAID